MHDILTRKKHSKRIAKLALKCKLIDEEFYNNLYLDEFEVQRRPKRKPRHKSKFRFNRYYRELYFMTTDYFGESDEHSLIDYISDMLFYKFNSFDSHGEPCHPVKTFNTTLKIIKQLNL